LEYKKKALLANEKNIFKNNNASFKNLVKVNSSNSLEIPNGDQVIKTEISHVRSRQVSKMNTNNLYATSGDNMTLDPTAEATYTNDVTDSRR
jgi:hypothetical protein